MKSPSIENFWLFLRERENIRLRREAGQSPPWTDDHILRTFHFCNIRREHDKGTQWWLKNVVQTSSPYFDDVLFRTILYRAVNNVAWWEKLGGVFRYSHWHDEQQQPLIRKYIDMAELPYSYAYIVLQGPDGRSRKDHLFDLLRILGDHLEYHVHQIKTSPDLKTVWRRLQDLPYIGPFIALQIYRDLLLVNALPFSDDDFTYLGPGTKMGLDMLGVNSSYRQQYEFVVQLRDNQPDWLQPKLTLGDVEHDLCEARKFWSLQKGGGKHRYYIPASRNLAEH